MLKYFLVIGLMFCSRNAFAQSDTQVYLFDIVQNKDSLVLKNGKNISQNSGYNNQPSFYDDDHVLYSRNQNGQTDIALYDIIAATTELITETKGSEYSPMRIPETDDIAAVRLDTTGLQRLYRYSLKDSTSTEISPLKIGYFDFFDADRMVTTVLKPTAMDLYFIDLKAKKDSLILKNVSRSICKVPGRRSISYTLDSEEMMAGPDLYILDIAGLESYFVCTLPIGREDYAWLDGEKIILGNRNTLFLYDMLTSNEWKEFANLENLHIKNISRIAVSPSGKKLAVVAEKLD